LTFEPEGDINSVPRETKVERTMNRTKTISSLTAILFTVLMVATGSAGATALTSPTGTVATPTIKGESEGEVSMHAFAVQCQWAFEGAVESHGEGKPTVVPLSNLTTSGCTNGWEAKTVLPGKLEINWTSGYNGTVTWTGATIETNLAGVICRYVSLNSHFGTITGGSPATIHINALIHFESGSAFCGGSSRQLTGSLKLTSPTSLYVDQ
jgi:hypothetical protein